MGCGICRVLYEELMANVERFLRMDDENDEKRAPEQPRNEKDIENILRAHSTALLAVIKDIEDEDVFRLDFKLEWVLEEKSPSVAKRTFILKQTGSPIAAFRTPMSGETSSSEVFKLALSWIRQCNQNCSPPCIKLQPVWYPTRLLDIRALKPKPLLSTRTKKNRGNAPNGQHTSQVPSEVTIKLVERSRDDPRHGQDVFGVAGGQSSRPNNLYVTLSHCWGQSQHYTLNSDTAADLKKGIKIDKVPKTFRDAIKFASELYNVGWIWIDSLCIYQKGPDSAQDWLEEAALMQRVYQESYLNISATAASNSGMGLYSERDCTSLWENEVNLKVEGLVLREDERHRKSEVTTVRHVEEPILSVIFKWLAHHFFTPVSDIRGEGGPNAKVERGRGRPLTLALPRPEGLRRCVLIDISHWDNLVNKAPVNSRAWVLQERLLAPRVLHFCKGSIAWECAGFTGAEGHPTGLPRFQLQNERILPEVSLKGLDPFKHGKELRNIKLGRSTEPDPHISERDLYGFELWARVVEVYSRLNLTVAKDKLIALSGIAQLMSTEIIGSEEDPARYVTGLWYKYLESQLLWRVQPIFIRHNRTFHHPSRRAAEYRAPSFSWASVDAQMGVDDQPGTGIKYGEVTDRDLLIELEKGENDVMIKTQTDNAFGLVTGGHIMLRGKLRKIRLSRGQQGSFYWWLVERNGVYPRLDEERHANIYLDAPDDDDPRHGIFESDNVYCLPAARGPRSEDRESKYIICLILQQAAGDVQVKDLSIPLQKGTFRRIGLAKLSGWIDKHTYQHILTPHATDTQLPHWPSGFDTSTDRHLIRVI